MLADASGKNQEVSDIKTMLHPFKVGTEKKKNCPGTPNPGSFVPLRDVKFISTVK